MAEKTKAFQDVHTKDPTKESRIVQLIVFTLGSEEFGANIDQVREIIRMGPITRVPEAPRFIKGVTNVRGEITVAVDLKDRFSLPNKEGVEAKHIVITEQERNLFGLIVDEVTEVLRIPETEIKRAPEALRKEANTQVSSVITLDNRLIIMLDLTKVLSEKEVARLAEIAATVKERRKQVQRPHYVKPELLATAPNQIWSWDITYLRTCVRGQFFYLYMIVDVWSRKIIAAQVFAEESMSHSSMLLTQACLNHGVQPEELVLHSDNGGPMKGATMLATLERLGVMASFSRPACSNDNPYSESIFRTLKYRPEYPHRPFETVEHARAWIDGFVAWYNLEHLHSAIGYVRPQQRHEGSDKEILTQRHRTYEDARRRNPTRWTGATRNWERTEQVRLNPKSMPLTMCSPTMGT